MSVHKFVNDPELLGLSSLHFAKYKLIGSLAITERSYLANAPGTLLRPSRL